MDVVVVVVEKLRTLSLLMSWSLTIMTESRGSRK